MIREKKDSKKIVIDLTGPEGNAFNLIGIARKLSKQIGKDPNPITTKMTSGDYENLIKVFDEEFGDFIILER